MVLKRNLKNRKESLMKSSIMLLMVFAAINLYAQNASSYFPAVSGYTWNYKIFPLDSANNENQTAAYYRIDSFTVVQTYMGKSANVITSKAGLSPGTPYIPLPDSTFISLEGSDAYTYYKLFNIDSLINLLSSGKGLPNSLPTNETGEWVSYYRFAQPENTPYTILSANTSVIFNNIKLNVNFEIQGIRLPDQDISTDFGKFTCKKFINNNIVNVYLALLPIRVTFFTISDTVWIASNQWILQDIMPSTKIDLGGIGLGTQFIPGSKKILLSQNSTGVNETETKINEFKLYQNFPNPFNPSTIIKYSLSNNSNVTLKVYNILGKEVATLVDKEQNAGKYQIEFNPSLLKTGLSTGVYFYRLSTGTASITKKLIYLK
jgi:hypothetical protein